MIDQECVAEYHCNRCYENRYRDNPITRNLRQQDSFIASTHARQYPGFRELCRAGKCDKARELLKMNILPAESSVPGKKSTDAFAYALA